MPSRALLALVLSLFTLAPSAAHADAPRTSRAPAAARAIGGTSGGAKGPAKATPRGPRSIGAPNQGKLANGVKLGGSSDVAVRAGASRWALPELVGLIQRATRAVRRKHGGAALLVGDLSAREGGPLVGHNSHQSGRDADIGFYLVNSKNKPFPAKRFLAMDARGQGREVDWLRFDDTRNWAFVRALLEDKHVTVRYVFVTQALRARLLAEGARRSASEDLLTRAAAAMMSPADADLHDDHFHIRIACPESMRGTCFEESLPRGKGKPDAAQVAAAPSAPREPASIEEAAAVAAQGERVEHAEPAAPAAAAP
jgi:penicillin-insensitive murein endopeptidase